MKHLTSIALFLLLNATAMAKEIKTQILIYATPEKVWSIFSKFNEYPSWNPFIKSVTGEVKVGDKIIVKIKPLNSKKMTFKPVIEKFETNKQLTWKGQFLFPGLIDGRHDFLLIDNGDGTTTFKHSEEFTGALVWIFNTDNAKLGFEAMNNKLKELSEIE